jgi:hypothetical protein
VLYSVDRAQQLESASSVASCARSVECREKQ